mgnify:CR=1 FL=1
MAYVTATVMVVLLQYFYFGLEVGRARARCGVAAPAVTGNEEFDRYFRVQQNTLEQVVMYVPASFACAYYADAMVAVICGVIFLIGRSMYFRAYVREPNSRTAGMIMTIAANLVLILATLVAIIRGWLL